MVSRTRKFRGSRTHGRGKKHGRGYGDRGGRGNAGLHKHKFKWMLIYDPDHFGAHGFVRHHHGLGKTLSINVEDVDRQLVTLMEKGFALKSGDAYEVDLTKAGYARLLGGGRARQVMKIAVGSATDAAKAKIQAAGGTVTTSEAAE
jgi:large subunit ribosomal protein L15